MKMEQNNEKKMTNYERKLQAREEAAKRAKRKSVLSTVAAVAIVACIAALLIIVPVLKNKELHKEYFKVNNESVSELEFNYHRTNLINNSAQYLQLFGITSLEAMDTEIYDQETGMTWSEFFTERAAVSIKESRALLADAKANNISLDTSADYESFMAETKVQADAAGLSTDAYLSSLYGANEKQLKNIIKDNLAANAYSNYLYEQKAATDEEAQAEYDANKNKYNTIDYRVLDFKADFTNVTADEDIQAAKDAAKAKAQEMLDKVKAGEDFETLCATYAAEDKRTDYADSETDKSLVTGETSTYAYQPYSEWLFDAARAVDDCDIYADEANDTYYVLLVENITMGEDVLDIIKDEMTYNNVIDYVAQISESYTISDPEDNLPTL